MFQETAVLVESGLADNPLMLEGLWDVYARKRSTRAASSTNSNVGKPRFPANIRLNSTPCESVSFSSAPNIFVCIIYIS